MGKNTDPDFADVMNRATSGEGLTGTEHTEIVGETNNEGGQKVVHHLKPKKMYVRGRGKFRQVVPDAEAKEIIRKMKEAKK